MTSEDDRRGGRTYRLKSQPGRTFDPSHTAVLGIFNPDTYIPLDAAQTSDVRGSLEAPG